MRCAEALTGRNSPPAGYVHLDPAPGAVVDNGRGDCASTAPPDQRPGDTLTYSWSLGDGRTRWRRRRLRGLRQRGAARRDRDRDRRSRRDGDSWWRMVAPQALDPAM